MNLSDKSFLTDKNFISYNKIKNIRRIIRQIENSEKVGPINNCYYCNKFGMCEYKCDNTIFQLCENHKNNIPVGEKLQLKCYNCSDIIHPSYLYKCKYAEMYYCKSCYTHEFIDNFIYRKCLKCNNQAYYIPNKNYSNNYKYIIPKYCKNHRLGNMTHIKNFYCDYCNNRSTLILKNSNKNICNLHLQKLYSK
jgi:hypothetical protein